MSCVEKLGLCAKLSPSRGLSHRDLRSKTRFQLELKIVLLNILEVRG